MSAHIENKSYILLAGYNHIIRALAIVCLAYLHILFVHVYIIYTYNAVHHTCK